MPLNGTDDLLVDSREPTNIVALLKDAGCPTDRAMLEVGDYQFFDVDGDLVLVSRKASDLFDSLHSGHLQDEFDRCINAITTYGGGRLFFLVEGVWSPSFKGGGGGMSYFTRQGNDWFRKARSHGNSPLAFPNMQVSVQTAGVYFIWTGSLDETAHAIAAIYHRAQEGWPSNITQGIKRPDLRFAKDGRVSRLMALWPHLHEKEAVRILRKFGSIGAIVDAARNDPKALLAVEGIGQKGLTNFLTVVQ